MKMAVMMRQYFKILYGAVLKSNSNIKMGVLTGAIRVAQAGIFSDLNNLKINTIFNEAYDEYFGLSQKEVEDILRYYGMEYTITEVKSWYDGYKFGKAEVYNPWSILNYIDNKELKAYWINTSGNVLIKNLLLLSDGVVFDDLQNLVNGNERIVFINENIAFQNLGERYQRVFYGLSFLSEQDKLLKTVIKKIKNLSEF